MRGTQLERAHHGWGGGAYQRAIRRLPPTFQPISGLGWGGGGGGLGLGGVWGRLKGTAVQDCTDPRTCLRSPGIQCWRLSGLLMSDWG